MCPDAVVERHSTGRRSPRPSGDIGLNLHNAVDAARAETRADSSQCRLFPFARESHREQPGSTEGACGLAIVEQTKKFGELNEMDSEIVIDRRRAWIVVALLFFYSVINFFDKLVLGLAAVPIMKELQLQPAQYGLVASSFYWLYAVSGFLVGLFIV